WSNGNLTNNPIDLCPGVYTLTITDDNNCEITQEYNIESPASFNAIFTDSTDILCRGQNTGQLIATGQEVSCGLMANLCGASAIIDTVSFGNLSSDDINYPSPFPNVAIYNRQQFLYLASELQAAGFTRGKISGIDLFV